MSTGRPVPAGRSTTTGRSAADDRHADSTRPAATFVGLATLDVVHHVARRPGPDEKVTAERQFVAAGGPAANAAVTFAALGGSARLVTAIGPGPVGRLIRADLEEHGVVVVDAAADGHQPPVSAITVERVSGTRSVTSLDASSSRIDLGPLSDLGSVVRPGTEVPGNPGDAAVEGHGETLPTAQADFGAVVVEGADAVLVDGHHPTLATAVARTAREAGLPVVLDAGRWKPVFADLLPYATVVICSSDFRLPEAADGSERTALALVEEHGVGIVVTTHGAGPVRWWHDGAQGDLPVTPIAGADTLGAGDAFHGAYLFAALDRPGSEITDRLGFAAQVAAVKCAHAGPRSWLRHLPAH